MIRLHGWLWTTDTVAGLHTKTVSDPINTRQETGWRSSPERRSGRGDCLASYEVRLNVAITKKKTTPET